MQIAALVLASLLATVQTVGWVECCCVLICRHHNDPCKDDCKKPEQTASHDCCGATPAPRAPAHDHGKRCSHVEPSGEIVSQAADLHPVAPLLMLDLPVSDPIAERIPAFVVAPPDSARGSPPLLHLLFGSLLI
jgi:hypothetical protein